MPSEALKSSLGAQLRALRRARGLTQEQLAEQLQVTPRYLAGVERGERNLTLDSVDALAKQLAVSPSVVLDASADED
ncbi:helix-turn-helix domain-containing protein [Microbacterium halotolerans]|uniref:helix-turn-helix domain-containing protein n=1 Tax=Microbacterium halotolerans TaxID=246613 RepID=UPI000E6AA75C|nr:helix-turn-helix transcriptional regulator [Microbacterium halotolerans]